MRVLVIGDRYIPATHYVAALHTLLAGDADVRTVDLGGEKGDQHIARQAMESKGPDAVPTPWEIVEAVGDAEVLALHFAPIPAAVLDAGRHLRAVAVARTGLENVDIAAATPRGIAVVPIFGRNASAVADLALGIMLSEARNIARADASIKAGGWPDDVGGPGVEIGGSTVGIVGFGHVGRELARRLHGFGLRLLVAAPRVNEALLREHSAERVDLDTLFRDSDFVHVTARLTPETRRLVGAEQFALMKPTAIFVNTARSRIVDYDALYDALAARRIAGAGLDVHDEEPLLPDSRWRKLNNVTLTPHYGGDTVTTNVRSARLVAEAIAQLARTGRCLRAINAAQLGWA